MGVRSDDVRLEMRGIRHQSARREVASLRLVPVHATHRIVEDSTMDTRRYLNESRSRTLAQFRWLGWVMLMMFVLVQIAMGAGPSGDRSDTLSQLVR